DIIEFDEAASKNQTPSTPAVSLMYALEVQLQAMQKEGIEARWKRHAAMQKTVEEWIAKAKASTGVDVGILAPAGSRSPTVSAIALPASLKGPDVANALLKRGITLGGGYGKLKDRTVRIGHMGDHTVATVERALGALGEALKG